MAKRKILSSIVDAISEIASSPTRYKITTAPKRLTNMAVWRAVDALESRKILPKKQADRIRVAVQNQQIDDLGGTGIKSLTKPFASLRSQSLENFEPIRYSQNKVSRERIEARRERINQLKNRRSNDEIVLFPESNPAVRVARGNAPDLPTDRRTNQLFDRAWDEMREKVGGPRTREYMQSHNKGIDMREKLGRKYRNARRIGAAVGIGSLGGGGALLLNAIKERKRAENQKSLSKRQAGPKPHKYF